MSPTAIPDPLSPYQVLRYGRFTLSEAAEAAGLPLSRVRNWIAQNGWAPLVSDSPGQGKARQLVLADVYRLAVAGKLSDPACPFPIPISRATQITDIAFGFAAHEGPTYGNDITGDIEDARRLAAVGNLDSFLTDRNRTQFGGWDSTWLIAGIVETVVPAGSYLRAELAHEDRFAAVLPNPNNSPRHFLTLEVTPLLAAVDEHLLRMRGFASSTEEDANG